MKRNFFLLFVSIMGSMSTFSQPPVVEQKHEDIEAQRVAFITSKLSLTPEEAQKFWPVYNKYRGELDLLRKGRATELMNAKINFGDFSDEEINQIIENEFTFRQKELDLQKKYNEEFKKVLSIKKVAMLYRAEQLFKLTLLQELKNKGPMMNPDNKGPK